MSTPGAFYLDHSKPLTPQVCKIIETSKEGLTLIVLNPEVYLRLLCELKHDKGYLPLPDGEVWQIGNFIDRKYPDAPVKIEMAMYSEDNWSEG